MLGFLSSRLSLLGDLAVAPTLALAPTLAPALAPAYAPVLALAFAPEALLIQFGISRRFSKSVFKLVGGLLKGGRD